MYQTITSVCFHTPHIVLAALCVSDSTRSWHVSLYNECCADIINEYSCQIVKGHPCVCAFTVPDTVHSAHDFRLAIMRLHIICERTTLHLFPLNDYLLRTRICSHLQRINPSNALPVLFPFFPPTEMAGYYKGGEVSPEDPAPQQYRIQRLLPPWAHSMGKSPVNNNLQLEDDLIIQCVRVSIHCNSWLYLLFPAGDGVLSRLSLRSARRWAGVVCFFCDLTLPQEMRCRTVCVSSQKRNMDIDVSSSAGVDYCSNCFSSFSS